jgi:hypothetical protein
MNAPYFAGCILANTVLRDSNLSIQYLPGAESRLKHKSSFCCGFYLFLLSPTRWCQVFFQHNLSKLTQHPQHSLAFKVRSCAPRRRGCKLILRNFAGATAINTQ